MPLLNYLFNILIKRKGELDTSEHEISEITLTGKKITLIKEYPSIANSSLTVGKKYDVVEEYIVKKRVSIGSCIPLDLKTIIDDNGELILINMVYFEEDYDYESCI